MANRLRAINNLKLANSILIGSIALIALGAAGGISAPLLVQAGTDVVADVQNLPEELPIVYGGRLDLSNAKIHVNNAFNQEGTIISGEKFKVEGYDPEFIGTQEVTLSYLNFKKVVKVTTAPQKLLAPAPTFDFNLSTLEWEPVANAEKYSVVLQTPDTHETISTFSVENGEHTYNFNGLQFYTRFETFVVALSDKKGSNGVSAFTASDPSEAIPLRKVPTIANVHYDLTDGKFKWDAVEGVSNYEVHINNVTLRPAVNEVAYDTTTPGVYNFSIRGTGSNKSEDFASTQNYTFERLKAPTISYASGAISVEDKGANLEYYKNGEVFTGDLSTIKEPGSYTVSAKNKASTQYELPSAMSNVLTLQKHEAPTISLVNGVLYESNVPEGEKVQYYLDGNAWNKSFDAVRSVGDHVITAKTIGSGTKITSESSNQITVTKLAKPEFTFDGEKFTFDAATKKEGFTIYVNDIRRDDLEDLPNSVLSTWDAGTYRISAANRGNGNELLQSDSATPITFLIPNVETTAGKSTDKDGYPVATLKLTHQIENVSDFAATVKVRWFKGGEQVEEETYSDFTVYAPGHTAIPRQFYFRKNSDRVVFKIDSIPQFGNTQVLKKTYSDIVVDK